MYYPQLIRTDWLFGAWNALWRIDSYCSSRLLGIHSAENESLKYTIKPNQPFNSSHTHPPTPSLPHTPIPT